MSVRDRPHYKIAAGELADWLERQGADRWWNIDGDPVLTGRLSLPCPVDELAPELRRVDRALLVLDNTTDSKAHGESIAATDLDRLARELGKDLGLGSTIEAWSDDRFFVLAWDGSDYDWLLLEDHESTKLAHEALRQQAGNS